MTCVDNSPDMLAILRQKLATKGLSADVYELDMCNLTLQEKFDLIIIPFNSFSEIISLDEQRKALKRDRELFVKNRSFICTLHNPLIRLKSVNGQLILRGKHSLPNDEQCYFSGVWKNTSENSL